VRRAAFLVLLVLAGCGSGKRPLILVDVDAAGLTVESVRIDVSKGGGPLATKTFSAVTGLIRAGIYLPAGTSGSVQVAAAGLRGSTEVGRSASMTVTVSAGSTAGPFTLALAGTAVQPDGGSPPDGGAPPPPADGGAPHDTAPSPDAALDTPADVVPGAPDGPSAAPDVLPPAASWQPPAPIETDAITSSGRPSVAIDTNTGNALVAWDEEHAIKVRRYVAATGAWDPARTLDMRGTVYDATVGIDGMGRAVMIWHQEGGSTDPALQGTWASQSSDQVTWSPPVRLASGHVYNVALAVSGNGSARAAWDNSDGAINSLWSAYFDGQSWTMPTAPVLVGTDPYERTPLVAMDGAGRGALVWIQHDGAGNDSVWGSPFTGSALTTPALLEDFVEDSSFIGDLAINADGKGLVGWTERTSSGEQFWYRTISAGTTLGPATQMALAADVSNIGLTVDPTGNVTACWAQGGAGQRFHVWSNRLPASGTWTMPAPLETGNYDELRTDTYPNCRLAADGQGDVQAIWLQRESAAANRYAFTLYAARYAGGTWSAAHKIAGKDGLGLLLPHLASAASGLSVAAYWMTDPAMTGDPDAYNVYSLIYR
jgi:hypothetical protein